MSEQNKAIQRRVFEEFWNAKDLSVADEIMDPSYVSHGLNAPPGPEGFKQFASAYFAAFPDLHFTIEELLADGDKTVARWTSTGTHQGELMGIAPTGKTVAVSGIAINRYEGGKVVESWDEWSALGMLQQLGVVPPMGE